MNNVRFYGKKPYKTAVIHGGPGALGSVAAIARELSKSYGVLEPLQTKNSITDLLLELKEVIINNCQEKIVLIGHSWGAWLVYLFAANYPELVNKIILVGSGPFESHYTKILSENRMLRLSDAEQKEFNSLIRALNQSSANTNEEIMSRLKELTKVADGYNEFEIDTDKLDQLPFSKETYSSIWSEAANLRKNGKLIKLANKVTCDIVVIHGDSDPHPLQGIIDPFNKVNKKFKVYELSKCGHNPWKETYAYQEFYSILSSEIKESKGIYEQ